MSGAVLRVGDLGPKEAAFLNPVLWGGKAIGNGERKTYRSVPITISNAARMAGSVAAAEATLARAARNPRQYGATYIFRPGEQFPTREFAAARLVLDQELLVTRGEQPFSIDPAEFPPYSGFRRAPYLPSAEQYEDDQHMRYWRGPSAVRIIKGENGDPQPVVVTRMFDHVGTMEYYRQVGVLPLPDVVQIGEVTHMEMRNDGAGNGHEMLLRTNAAYVFPDGRQ